MVSSRKLERDQLYQKSRKYIVVGFRNIQEHCQSPTSEGGRPRNVRGEDFVRKSSKPIKNPLEIVPEYLFSQPLGNAGSAPGHSEWLLLAIYSEIIKKDLFFRTL